MKIERHFARHMLAWGFGDFKGGEIFPWRNFPLRNCPRAKFPPPLVKEEEQPWLRGHNFLPPSQFASWPSTSVWDFLRVHHDYFWHRWASEGEASPILDNVRHAFGSRHHVSRDSVHQVVGYSPDLCRLHRSLVEDMRLDMGGTDDVGHAVGWFDAGSGQGCPLSPLDWTWEGPGEIGLQGLPRGAHPGRPTT